MDDDTLATRLHALTPQTVPGVAFVAVGAEGVRARAAAGFADLTARRAMTTATSVCWFSMTKIATATTVLRLAGQGVLDLDEPVVARVPAMHVLRPSEWAGRITPRHLLQHSAGLTNPIPVRWVHPADVDGPDPGPFLRGLLEKHPKLRFEPGARSSYSNLGTLILGAALAQAAGAGFTSVVREKVLDPVGMSSTGFAFDPSVPQATGYHPRRSPMKWLLPRWVLGEPAGKWLGLRPFLLDGAAYGGLVGTADDAARFLRLHLRDGEIDGTRVISADAARQMRHVEARGRRFDLGLGWFVPSKDRRAEPAFVEHLGAGAGFFNVLRIYPSLGVGAVVMGNATKYDIDAVARLALEFRE